MDTLVEKIGEEVPVVSRLGVDGNMGVGDYNMRFRFSTMYDAKKRGHSKKVSSIF